MFPSGILIPGSVGHHLFRVESDTLSLQTVPLVTATATQYNPQSTALYTHHHDHDHGGYNYGFNSSGGNVCTRIIFLVLHVYSEDVLEERASLTSKVNQEGLHFTALFLHLINLISVAVGRRVLIPGSGCLQNNRKKLCFTEQNSLRESKKMCYIQSGYCFINFDRFTLPG